MTRSTFQVGDIFQPERQRAEIERLKDTLGVANVIINIESKTVTFEHDQGVTVASIENALRGLRLNPSLIMTAE
ncbi:hypothetical protein SUGI_1078070 [Cryptomeria japonica]|nr:hypothetical protein SUGI_1078070 [Cryptomeria japonica]